MQTSATYICMTGTTSRISDVVVFVFCLDTSNSVNTLVELEWHPL